MKSPSPKTIGDRLKGKTLVGNFMTSDTDEKNKSSWTERKSSYSTSAQSGDEEILKKENIGEKDLSDKCQDILEMSLSDGDSEAREVWASK